MKLFQKKIIAIMVILSGVLRLGAAFDPHNLKDLWSAFKSDYHMLSPVQGALCYSTKFLNRFYVWGPEEWPTCKLVRSLFHVLPEGTIRLGQQKSNWVKGLDGELVGHIITWLCNGAKYDQKQVLQNEWYEKYTKAIEGMHQKIKKRNGAEILELMKESFAFDPKVTIALLMSVLYLRDDVQEMYQKKKMIDYLRALQEGLGDAPFVKPLTEDVLGQMLHSRYTSEELVACGSLESMLIAHILNIKQTIFSPKIIQRSYSFNGQGATPNCTETALMDFFCILFFDPVTKKFTFDTLPVNVQASLSDRLRTFFIKNNDSSLSNNSGVQQEWMNTVSGIEGFKSDAYVKGTVEKGRYEIEPDADNLLAFINYLLGTSTDSWDELGPLLTTNENIISCHVAKTGNSSVIKIKSSKYGLLRLHVEKNAHAYLIYLMRDESVDHDVQECILFLENNHSFYVKQLEDRNKGLELLEEMFKYFRIKVINFEGMMRTYDSAFSLIKKGYFGDDPHFYKKIFELVMQNNSEDLELFTYLIDAFVESKKISLVKLFEIINDYYQRFDFYQQPCSLFIQRFSKDMLGKREDGSFLFSDCIKKHQYRLALLLVKIGVDMSHIDEIPLNFLFSCNIPIDEIIDFLTLDCVDKNQLDFCNQGLWHVFCQNFRHWYKYQQFEKYMLDATEKGIITTINIVAQRPIHGTPLDFLIAEKEAIVMSVYPKKITDSEVKPIVDAFDDLITKMRGLGAKTAQELGVRR